MDFFDFLCYNAITTHSEAHEMKDSTLFETKSDLYENCDIGMYYCGKRINTINHVYGPEIRNYYLFLLVNKGNASFFHKSSTVKLEAHDLLVMCPGERIHYEANTPWSIQWVGLYGQTVENYMNQLSIDGDHPIIHLEQYYEMEQILEELYQISAFRTEYTRCKQIELIYRFFSLLLQKNSAKSKSDTVESARKIIDYNFDRDLTVGEISDTLHFDPAYLTRKFTQEYGVCPKEYLIEKRMEHAKKLLRDTEATINEIAFSVGYVDQLYFSRIFKKKTGISPTEYRMSFKK